MSSQHVVVVRQRLARGGQGKPLGVEHGPHEERPVGQHVRHRLADEHALGVEPVPTARAGGVRQDEGLAPNPRHGVGEVHDVQWPGPDHHLAEGERGIPPAPLPREAPSCCDHRPARGLDDEIHGQVGGVRRREPFDDLGAEQVGCAPSGSQGHVGAGFGAWLRGGGHRVRAVVAAHPQPGLVGAGPPRRHPDLVGDEEARQQPDAELTEEALARQPQGVAFGGGADGREHRPDAVLVEPDTGVVDVQAAVRGEVRWHDAHPARGLRIVLRAGGHGVERVLEELTKVDPGPGVQVVRQQVDHASQVDVEW